MNPTCARCGTEQRARALFCRRCGASLAAAGEVVHSSRAEAPIGLRTSSRVIWLALGSYGVLLVANLAVILGRVDLRELRSIQCVLAALALGAFFATLRLSSATSLGTFVSFENVRLAVILRIIGGMAAALAAAWALGLVLHTQDSDLMRLYREQGQSKSQALLDGSVIAPLLEEVVFRGIVLGALIGPLRRSGALWSSALMFATLHLTPLTVVHHTLLGLVTGYARLETRGLVVPIAIHASYNALIFAYSW